MLDMRTFTDLYYKQNSGSPVWTCQAWLALACTCPWWWRQDRWHHCNTGRQLQRCCGPGSGSGLMKHHRKEQNRVKWWIKDGTDEEETHQRWRLSFLCQWKIFLLGLNVFRCTGDIMPTSECRTVCPQWVERSHFIHLAEPFVQSDFFSPPHTHTPRAVWGLLTCSRIKVQSKPKYSRCCGIRNTRYILFRDFILVQHNKPH